MASSPTVLEVKLPRLQAHQQPVAASPARFKVLACGRRWGKTELAKVAALSGHGPMGEHGIPVFPGALHGKKICWIAPTISQANEELWPKLVAALNGAWEQKLEQQKRIDLYGGGVITVRSGEAMDTIRGSEYDGVVIEEAAFQKKALWTRILRPTLIDRKGWAIFISTPNAKALESGEDENWFAWLYREYGTKDGWARWQLPSSDRKTLDPAELEDLTADMSTAEHQEEILAQFQRPEELALVKRGWWRDFDAAPKEARTGGIFIDLAHEVKKESDFTAMAVVKTDGINFYWEHVSEERMLFPDALRAAKDLRATYSLPLYIEDQANSKPLIQALQRETWGVIGLPLEGRDKLARLSAVTHLIEAGNCHLKKDAPWRAKFIEQHANFPNVKHDDMVDTTSLALGRLSRRIGARRSTGRGNNVVPFRRAWERASA